LDNPIVSKEDGAADNESDIECITAIKDPECLEQQELCAAPNVPGLVRPTPKSNSQCENVLVTVNALELRRNT